MHSLTTRKMPRSRDRLIRWQKHRKYAGNIFYSISRSSGPAVFVSIKLLLIPMNFQIIFLGKLETTREESKVVKARSLMGNGWTDIVEAGLKKD